jgi:nitrogen fixation NifU-like protein
MDLEILKIASDTENHKVLENCTHISKQKNPLCGDEMQISLKISNNKIVDFAYQCKSCIYCQASVSILSKYCINKSIKTVRELISLLDVFFENNNSKFPKELMKFSSLFNKKNLSRKECILLPLKTLTKALKS